ncbi:hypothetical protein GQ44DRAFT_697389, partial [Phaeosphaeriaceae sp. PMI808]
MKKWYFGTEISGNRMRKDEGAVNKKVAEVLRCSKRTVQQIKQRVQTTHSTASRPRIGRPRVLNDRDIRRLERIVKKYLKIEYLLLMKEAGLWDEEAAQPTISRSTVRNALAAEGLRKFRAKQGNECSVARGSGHNIEW